MTAPLDLSVAPASARVSQQPAAASVPAQERSPYPGLRPFDRDEADVFFGREQQTDQLLAKLATHRLLAVVGSSGSGKSSLVRAGLIASLETGLMASAGSVWRVAVIRPGSAPMAELANAALTKWKLAGDDGRSATSRGLMEAKLRSGPLSLVESINEARLPPKTNLLLVVDQFEEIFRFRREGGRDDADAFVELLLTTAQVTDANVYTVLTMRSDFLGGCSVFADLPEALNEAQFLCPQLTRKQRQTAITGPARVFGGDVDEALVNRLLNEIGPEPDNLPVLQHLLMRMWSHAKKRKPPEVPKPRAGSPRWPILTVEDEKAVGGLKEALSQHADEVLAELDGPHRRLTETVFRRLCDRRIGHGDTRRPTELGELAQVAGFDKSQPNYDREIRVVVDQFRRESAGFLRPGEDEPIAPDTFIDISHEALIRFWKQLGEWTRAEFHSAETYRLLAQTAALWQQGTSALWSSPNLENALAWKEREHPNEAWAARYGGDLKLALRFLEESKQAQELAQTSEREKVDSEWRQELARGRKKTSALLVVLQVLVLGMVAAYICSFREYEADYGDFVRSFGHPVGIQALSHGEQTHNAVSFRLRRRGLFGDVVSMKAIDASGALTTQHNATTYADYSAADSATKECEWRYDYDSHGHVMHEAAYDKTGKPVWTFVYSTFGRDGAEECKKAPCIRTGFFLRPTRSVTNAPSGATAAAANGGQAPQGPATVAPASPLAQDVPRTGSNQAPRNGAAPAAAFGPDRSSSASSNAGGGELASPVLTSGSWGQGRNVSEFQIEYDPSTGRELVVRYYDHNGKRVRGRDEAFGIRRTYDSKGREVRTESIDERDAVMLDKTGNAISTAEFAENDDVLAYQRLDSQGHLTAAKAGFARVEYKYDEFHRFTEERYFSEKREPTLLKDGYHAVRYVRDDAGRIIEQSYFDTKMNPTNVGPDDENGYPGWYHVAQTSYDAQGRATEYRYFDSARKPVITSEGYSVDRMTLNAQGRVTVVVHFGVDGKTPIANKSGVARHETDYDAVGNAVAVRTQDGNGKATLNADGIYAEKREFDGEGQQIGVRYFGIDSRPKAVSDGYAGYRSEYDADGTLTAWSYFDVDEQPVSTQDGYFGVRLKLEQGREIEHVYVDANGKPLMVRGGYASYKTQYSEWGNPKERTYFDANGTPVIRDDGTAGWRVEADAFGRETKKTYLGVDSKPVAYQDGYVSVATEYDARDNVSKLTYLNAASQPVVSRSGYAMLSREYDAIGNLTSEAYFDSAGQPTASADGYARVKNEYDSRGHVKKSRYFDAAGKPLTLKSGYCALENEYDAKGLLSQTTFLAASGRPTPSSDGYARASYEYDEQYRRVQNTSYFDVAGKPTLAFVEGYHARRSKYDDLGHVRRVEYTGVAGEPTLSKEGFFAAEMVYDVHGNVLSRSYFDTKNSPVEHSLGYFQIASTYDRISNEVLDRRFDVSSKQFRSTRYDYDASGNFIAISYFDANGHPVLVDGSTKQVRTYDALRNLVETTSLKASGLVYLEMLTTFDEQKRAIRYDYSDGRGVPVLGRDRAARFELSYDQRGNDAEYRLFDAHGARGRPSDGLARTTLKYDADNNLIERATFSATGQPQASYGVVKSRFEYDAGRKVLEERYGADGKLAPCPGGLVAQTRYSYDDFGRVTEERYLGPNGESVPLDCYSGAQHRTTYEYDERGNCTTEKHYAAKDAPANGFVLLPAIQKIGSVRAFEWQGTYDAKGELASFTCFAPTHEKTREWGARR